MPFNAETALRMEAQIRKVDRGIKGIERMVRPHRNTMHQLNRNLSGAVLAGSGVGAILQHTDTKRFAAGTFLRPLMQSLQPPAGWTTVADQAAKASMNLALQQRPLQAFAATGTLSPVIQRVTRNAWRPVLMRGFQGIKSAAHSNALQTLNDIAPAIRRMNVGIAASVISDAHPTLQLLRSQEALQARFLNDQVSRSISAAMSAHSAWARMSESLENYRLQDVRIMPLPHDGVELRRPLPYQPRRNEPLASSPESSVVGQQTPLTAEPGEAQELTGIWTVLQPLENAVQRVNNGSLVVRIMCISIGTLVIQVVAGGIVYFLFYRC